MKHIRIIHLGCATITATNDPDVRIDPFEVIGSMPEFKDRIEFSFLDRTDIQAGYMMQPSDIVEASREIRRAADEGVDGVVLIMGTDCLEEGSFGMDLLTQDLDIAIVVTGGMCTADMYSADGPGNMFDAVCTAASDEAKGLGVLVVINNWIHAAEYVQKVHPYNKAAFSSEFPIGMVCEGDVSIRTHPVRRKMPWIDIKTDTKKVFLQYCYLGINGDVLSHVIEDGYEGIVVGGTGGCDVVPALFDQLEAFREKYGDTFPIVIGTRIGKGEPLKKTYGDFVGSPSYIHRNYLMTGQLDCLKARVLLVLLLMSECTPEQIRKSFEMFSCK